MPGRTWNSTIPFSLVLALTLATAAAASAQTIRYVAPDGDDTGNDCASMGNPCATISHAVGQAASGDTIEIADGEYTEPNGVAIDISLILQGESENGTVIQAHAQEGQATSRVFILTPDADIDVAMADLTVRHGVASGPVFEDATGGGIYGDNLDGGRIDLQLNRVTVRDNEARWGGGLGLQGTNDPGTSLTLTEVTVRDNIAREGGGGMLTGQSSTTVMDTAFAGNESLDETLSVGGGGAHVTGGSDTTHSFHNLSFVGNETASSGGGMLFVNAEGEFVDVEFIGNMAAHSAGGLGVSGVDPVRLERVLFSGNAALGTVPATGVGGGLVLSSHHLEQQERELIDVDFVGNHALQGGGLWNAGPAELTEIRFLANEAVLGGGMYNQEAAASLSGVSFTANLAEQDGGGLYDALGAPTLANVRFDRNSAERDGGGMFGDQGSSTLVNVLFGRNGADERGGGMLHHGSTADLTNVTLGANTAGIEGGGLFNRAGSEVEATDIIVWGNTATGDGNQVYNDGDSSVALTFSLFGNAAGDIVQGGGFSFDLDSLTQDPNYVDTENGNLRLSASSPAVDAGDPAIDPGIFPVDGMGTPVDLDGNPRFLPDTSAIDMGAYERGSPLGAVLAFQPPSLDFGDELVGTLSASRTATLVNFGDAAASGLSFAVDPADGVFDANVDGFGAVLPAGGSCVLSVTFGPTEAGGVAALLTAMSDQDAVALGLVGTGIGGAFTPIALELDLTELASDANGVFEPGEQVETVTSWRNNDVSVPQSLTGAVSAFTGPPEADYTVVAPDADYGPIGPGETASCLATGVCYQLAIDDPAVRPATHWDALLEETLDDPDDTAQGWLLHIGDSFTDVPTTNLFYSSIETLLHSGVTGGCTATEYCPGGANNRSQMPVFVLKALHGPDYVPPACVEGEEEFADVPSANPFCRWIEELARRDVVSGCGDDSYCPSSPVTRAEMAIFLLKTLEGGDYEPPACSSTFDDVPCPSLFADWIEELASREITGGCAADAYCPGDPVSRAQMAVFVTRTFGLTLYGP